MNENIQRRGERVTSVQKQIIIEFMEDNIDFARHKLLGLEGKITNHNLWQVLCEQLNASGPEKSITKWQRVWTDIKIKTRRKALAIASSRRKAGGGEPIDKVILDEFDEKIINIISEKPIQKRSSSSNVPLDSEERVSPIELLHKTFSANKKRKIQWAQIAEDQEQEAISEQLSENYESLVSPATSSDINSETNTSQKTKKKRSMDAEAVDELKDLSKQNSTEALSEVGAELRNLNKNMTVLINQNEEMVMERKQTNNILLRIAKALESKQK